MDKAQKLRCYAYAFFALGALILCWNQNLYYAPHGPVGAFIAFGKDLLVNPASKSITIDIFFFFFSAWLWMFTESRKYKIRHLWAYIVFGLLIAISVTFPLFLIARELKMAEAQKA